MNSKVLLSGNEAIARGAWEAGVSVATGYPGTPSTEILETLVRWKHDVYCEWSPNEKVAFEVAAGASLSGSRVIVTMKHVGLNVAADPLMTLSYIGVEGGFVVCVADDPGMHSSQTEQDTRHYARLAKVPVFEPSNSQEAKDFMLLAMELSERHRTPVILRTTTRVSHSRSLVEPGERIQLNREIGFIKDPSRHVPIPIWGRIMRREVESRLAVLSEDASISTANSIEWRDRSLGIIAPGIACQYAREIWPDASMLRLGFSYPFPDKLIRQFAEGVHSLLVVEELDDILEEHIKALGLLCLGKDVVPRVGELSPSVLRESKALLEADEQKQSLADNNLVTDLPARPPVLCPSCPHRGIFYALTKHDVVVTGDIGCYSLGVFRPLDRMDVILCMGGGVTLAHGMEKAGEPEKIVGMVGDSTFFHSGVTGIMDIAYNRGATTIIVVDNRTTAMTGHQDHPGTGSTLMGESTVSLSIPELAKACGFRRVRVVNPYDLENTGRVLADELEAPEPSLIVSQAPCPLHERKAMGPYHQIIEERCRACRLCLRLGCPAIEGDKPMPKISALLCGGCGLCMQVCPHGAITPAMERL